MRAYKRMAKFSILIAIISLLIAILLNFYFVIDKTGFCEAPVPVPGKNNAI